VAARAFEVLPLEFGPIHSHALRRMVLSDALYRHFLTVIEAANGTLDLAGQDRVDGFVRSRFLLPLIYSPSFWRLPIHV
jgi:hypothetical protein